MPPDQPRRGSSSLSLAPPIAWATCGTAWISYAANTADAAANFIPGKGLIEDAFKGGIKTGIKDLTEIAAKDFKTEIQLGR